MGWLSLVDLENWLSCNKVQFQCIRLQEEYERIMNSGTEIMDKLVVDKSYLSDIMNKKLCSGERENNMFQDMLYSFDRAGANKESV